MRGAGHLEMAGLGPHSVIESPEWSVEVGTSPVDFEKHGDEWFHWLTDTLPERAGVAMGGYAYDTRAEPPYLQVFLDDANGPLPMVLVLDVGEREVGVMLSGLGRAPESAFIGGLKVAVTRAAGMMGANDEQYEWTAFIGHPAERSGWTEKRLTAPFTVGSLHVSSTEVNFVEPDYSGPDSMTRVGTRVSVPLMVTGTQPGYDWPPASLRMGRDLRTLCGLLSVAWEAHMTVKAGPQEGHYQGLSIDRPPKFQVDRKPVSPGDPVVAPPWLSEAWERLERDPALVRALDAFLEGLDLESSHPSMAAVAFTACLETLAVKLYRLERCTACNSSTGIGRSVKAALRLVLSEEKARTLDSGYGKRSSTVHSGRFHAHETTPGGIEPFWASSSASTGYRLGLLRLRGAARDLLRMALLGQLPEKLDLPPPTGSTAGP